MGCHFLFQRIFPTQGSNWCLLHWQVDSILLSHLGSLKRLLTSLFSNYIYYEAQFPSHLATKTIYCNRLNTKAGMRISMNQYEYQQIKLKQKCLCPQLKKNFLFYIEVLFPVVVYGCESWTVKKAERGKVDVLKLCCWRRLLRVP